MRKKLDLKNVYKHHAGLLIMNLIKKTIIVFSFPIMVFVIHLLLLFFGFYTRYEWIDIPMHFLGGFSVLTSYLKLLNIFERKKLVGKIDKLILFVFMISLIALTAVLLEFGEFMIDLLFDAKTQIDVPDIIGDLFFGVVGGICGFLCFYRNKQ